MLKFWRNLLGNQRGNALLIAAGAMPMIVGAAGLASDTIQWSLWKRQLQRAADSAAIAGVYERVDASGGTSNIPSAVAHDLTLNQHTWMSNLSGYPQITYPLDSGAMTNQVKVSLAIQQSLPFSSLFMTAAPTIIANSTAAGIPAGEYCVVSLEPLASKSGITVGGSTNIDMNCGMISNSPATNSALANGNASTVKATVIAAVGGVQASNTWTVPQYNPYSPPYADPFANLPVPTPTGCTNFPTTNDLNFTGDPAHASGQIVCFKSDMKIQGNVVLGSATYVLDAASIKMSSTGASLSCNGCTIILTSSTAATNPSTIGGIDVSGGLLQLTAPTTGTYHGIALYQDRRALDSNVNKINGGSGSIIQGTLYFPSQELDYNGNGTTAAICTQFVTRRVVFSGSSTISNKFAKGSTCGNLVGATLGGGTLVRLVA